MQTVKRYRVNSKKVLLSVSAYSTGGFKCNYAKDAQIVGDITGAFVELTDPAIIIDYLSAKGYDYVGEIKGEELRPLNTYEIGAINTIKFYTQKMKDFQNGIEEVEFNWKDNDMEMTTIKLTPEQVEKRINDYKSSIKHYAELHRIQPHLRAAGIEWLY